MITARLAVGGVHAVAITPNGLLAVCAGEDASVRSWLIDAGTCQQVMQGHKGWVVAVAISADSDTAVSASHDCTLR